MNKSKKTEIIRGFIFDIGDVIYDASPWRKWLLRELRAKGVTLNYSQLVARWEALLADVYVGQASYWERFDSLLLGLGLKGECASHLKVSAQLHGKNCQVDREPFPRVVETLAELKVRGYRVAALSDTESTAEKVRCNLRSLAVEDYFDSVTTSFDCGFSKPTSHAYKVACKSLELDHNSCAFVGHDIDELMGATLTGLTSIAFNYDPDAIADIFIDRFDQLLDLEQSSAVSLSRDSDTDGGSCRGDLP